MTVVTIFVIIGLLCEGITAQIFYLNETEYNRMPAIYSLDNFDKCLRAPEGLYCAVNFELVSDNPNELLHMIEEYSKATIKHFNHTKLRYGICVNENCQQYVRDQTMVSAETLEGCLNKSLWENYGLKTRVSHHTCYTSRDKNFDIHNADIVVAVVLLLIIMINVVGSIYDVCFKIKVLANELLLCFSISRNWKKLISKNENHDSSLQRLKGLNGIRCIILGFVMLVHCIWPPLLNAMNTRDLEMNYDNPLLYIISTGSLAIQSYIVVSGFLLVYKMQLHSENNEINWLVVPKGIFLRYLRLTPSLAVIIAIMATWLRFLGPGPLWELSGALELEDCRNHWWANLLYINNYLHDSKCLMHTWYLAVDVQLYCLGLIICVMLKTPGHRRIMLSCLLVMGLIITAAHIYLQDLDAILIVRPEVVKTLFVSDQTFNQVYKKGHTNLPSYVVGLSLGYLVYRWSQGGIDVQKYKKNRILYWLSIPLCLAIILSGRIFYRDAPRDPAYIRAMYGALSKLIFAFFFAIVVLGLIFQIEGFYRRFLEWKGWRVPACLSYGAFLLHFPLLTVYASAQTELKVHTLYTSLFLFGCLTIVSFLTATILCLMVEAPFIELTKYVTSELKTEKNICKTKESIISKL